MKKSLILLTCLIAGSAMAQLSTNIYTATLNATSPIKRTFVVPNVWTTGLANYRNDTAAPTNHFYIMETNFAIFTYTTSTNVVLQASTSAGETKSGYGQVMLTNSLYPNFKQVIFSVYWPSNNTPVPTNTLVPVTVIGTHPATP